MAAFAAGALLALTIPALLVNLYFTALTWGRWLGLRRGLAAFFNACGADTSSCARVVGTPYARVLGGVPNVVAGLLWCAALLVLAARWAATGTLGVPWPYLAVAAGTLAMGLCLVGALVFILREPCPL